MRKESVIGSRIAEFRSNAMSRSAEFASPSHPPDAHGSLPTLVDLRIATGFARPLAGGDSTFFIAHDSAWAGDRTATHTGSPAADFVVFLLAFRIRVL